MMPVTWSDLKQKMQEAGVDDATLIDYIDIQPWVIEDVEVELTPDKGVPGSADYKPETVRVTG